VTPSVSRACIPGLPGLVLALLTAACASAPPQATLVEETRVAMGSSLRIAVWTSQLTPNASARRAVFITPLTPPVHDTSARTRSTTRVEMHSATL